MSKCLLCNSEKQDDILYGKLLTRHGISVHTHCLYLSSNLAQNGKDENGFFGFLPSDIKKEAQRVASLRCIYCRKLSANIGCCNRKCRNTFHLICGLEHNCQNEFACTFNSYCHRHTFMPKYRPAANECCCICYDSLRGADKIFSHIHMLRAPCCRNGWFHKRCLQKYANTSGYYFKCPLCNDSNTCREELLRKGIFIPERDADWESEPNAYADLLERPNSCSAAICEANSGRSVDSASNPLMVCNTCGAVACHKNCMPIQSKTYCCNDCQAMLANSSSRQDADEDVFIVVDDSSDSETSEPKLPRRRRQALRLLDDDNCDEDSDSSLIVHRNRSLLIISDGEEDIIEIEQIAAPSTRVDGRDKETSSSKEQFFGGCCADKNGNFGTECKCGNVSSHSVSASNAGVPIEGLGSESNSNQCSDYSSDHIGPSRSSFTAASRLQTVIVDCSASPSSSSGTNSSGDKQNENSTSSSNTSDSSNYRKRRCRPFSQRKRRITDSDLSLNPSPKCTRIVISDEETTSSSECDEDPVECYRIYAGKLIHKVRSVHKHSPASDDGKHEQRNYNHTVVGQPQKEFLDGFVLKIIKIASESPPVNCGELDSEINRDAAGSEMRSNRSEEWDTPIRNDAISNAVNATDDEKQSWLNESCIARRTRRSYNQRMEKAAATETNENVLNRSCVANRTRRARRTNGGCPSPNTIKEDSESTSMNESCVANRTRRRQPLESLETFVLNGVK